MSNTLNSAVTGIIIGLFGVSLGFGTSQLMGMAEVRALTVDIRGLHIADDATNMRVEKLSTHLDKLIEQNTELITLLRVQTKP